MPTLKRFRERPLYPWRLSSKLVETGLNPGSHFATIGETGLGLLSAPAGAPPPGSGHPAEPAFQGRAVGGRVPSRRSSSRSPTVPCCSRYPTSASSMHLRSMKLRAPSGPLARAACTHIASPVRNATPWYRPMTGTMSMRMTTRKMITMRPAETDGGFSRSTPTTEASGFAWQKSFSYLVTVYPEDAEQELYI